MSANSETPARHRAPSVVGRLQDLRRGPEGKGDLSARLQQLLKERLSTRARIEVISAGVNAWSCGQTLRYFRERALAYSPDFVLIGDGNLWTQFSDQTSPEFPRKFQSRALAVLAPPRRLTKPGAV